MANEPLRRTPARPVSTQAARPKLWAEGEQRPPFVLSAFGTASLHLSREGVAPLHAWAARTARRVAVNVRNGAGRIPEAKLGRAARFVPSHQRVAGWIKTFAAILAHASATADTDIKRGNALVAEIEPHLWPTDPAAPASVADAANQTPATEPVPVVLPEPMQLDDDPLASIRDDLAAPQVRGRSRWQAQPRGNRPDTPYAPPPPPGAVGTAVIQVSGYVLGWTTSIFALPYGAGKALWLHIKGIDLRGIGAED